jgi:protein-S-isoprenylcysteine O-methyltransferase Ste14
MALIVHLKTARFSVQFYGSTILIPGVISAVLVIVRTALEDKTLQAELPGYQEYTQHARYRLLPGVW